MDPLFRGSPSAEGWYQVEDCVRLHYELYRPEDGQACKGLVLLVMGAFATKKHFASTAAFLASSGYEVLTYDHRGVGKSGLCTPKRQTSSLLAQDAVQLLDFVWGPESLVHVYGASMGGMIAQELALLLLDRQRLASLGLAVTCRGLRPFGGALSPLFNVRLLAPLLGWWYTYDRQRLVERLLQKLLTQQVRAARHPSGQTCETVYYREWLAHFDDYWTFKDPVAGACHAGIVLTHHLTDEQAATLRNSNVPILVQVSEHDLLVSPKLQRALAHLLNAKSVSFPTGHMGLLPWKDAYHAMLLEHFETADILRAVNAADTARAQLAAEDAALPDTVEVPKEAVAAAQLAAAAGVFLQQGPRADESSSSGAASGNSSSCSSSSLARAASSSTTDLDTSSTTQEAATPIRDTASPEAAVAGGQAPLGRKGSLMTSYLEDADVAAALSSGHPPSPPPASRPPVSAVHGPQVKPRAVKPPARPATLAKPTHVPHIC